MFGRIAAGLVHDLSHPIQNIGNSCKLILKMFDDLEYRETFKRTVEREMVVGQARARRPAQHRAADAARALPDRRQPVGRRGRRVDAAARRDGRRHARAELGAGAGVHRRRRVRARPRLPQPDHQRDPGDGAGRPRVDSRPRRARSACRFASTDTGCGIPPERLGAIFDDFVTTKRRGLGLGLAISKKIVEQLGGTITVASEVGKGTTFMLDFPRTQPRPMAVGAAAIASRR